MRVESVVVAFGILALAGCSPTEPEIDYEAEEQAIHQLNAEWFAAEASRDMEATLSYMAAGVINQPEGAPTTVGLDAARTFYEDLFKIPYANLERLPRTVVVAAAGDLAYDVGPFNIVFENESGLVKSPAKSMAI